MQIVITNREIVDAPELGLELASALRKQFPGEFDIAKINTLLANQAAFQQLQAGQDPRRIAEDWRDGVERFMPVRAKYLIYQEK